MKCSGGRFILLNRLTPESGGSEGIGSGSVVSGDGRVVEMSTSSIFSLFSIISEISES